MDLLKTFKTDKKSENDGVWVLMDDGKSRIKVARWGNTRFREAMHRKMQRYKMAAKVKTIPEDVYQSILSEVMSETILMDWENMTWGGEPLPYTHENVMKALELEDFKNIVSGFADDMANFKAELDQATEKNSVRP